MLHNNNQFGQSDVPMSGETNLTSEQMINPNNANNLGKITQQPPQPLNSGFNLPEFPYGLNMNAGMSQYPNFQSVGFPQNFMSQNPMNWQNNVLPMNLNIQNGPYAMPYDRKPYHKEANLLNVPQVPQKYKIESHVNNYVQYNDNFHNNQQYRPVHPSFVDNTVNKHRSAEGFKQYLENNLGLSVKVSENHDIIANVNKDVSSKQVENCLLKGYLEKDKESVPEKILPTVKTSQNLTPKEVDLVKEIMEKSTNEINPNDNEACFSVKAYKDSDSRKRSLEKTLRMLEISIINSTNSRKLNEATDTSKRDLLNDSNTNIDKPKEDTKQVNHLNQKPIVEPTKQTNIESTNKHSNQKPTDDETNETCIEPQEEVETSQETNRESESDDDEIDPIQIDKIKEETSDSVEVKVEILSQDTDVGPNPFQRDIFGVQSEYVFNRNVYDSELGLNIAKEMIKIGGSSDSYFECPYCSLFFNNPKRFLIHIKWHSFGLTNEKRFELQREKEMKKQMKREARIQVKKQNEDKKDVQDGPKKCTVCQKSFGTYGSLKNHRQKFHPTRSRNCKVCGKSILGWLAMKQHLTTHDEVTYNCPDCPKRFKHAHSLAKHRDTHKEKTQACSQCPKKFGSVTLLNIHMKTHERMLRGATFRCTYCGKGYFESFSLAAHERTHRNEKPFTCDICNSRFGTNSSLKRHLKVSHNNTKPYECRTCHRCFMQESIRDRHELRLHGNPEDFKYPCKLCSSKFFEMKDLKKHLYKVHPKVKRKKNSDSDYSDE